MKKVLAIFMAAVFCIGALAACGNSTTTTTAASAAETTAAADSQATETEAAVTTGEGFKIGVILYDTECQWAKDIMGSVKAIGEPLGCTFETALSGSDPEDTVEAVQNFGAAGYDGIINLHPGTVMSKIVEVCEQYGMYVVTSNDPASASEEYSQFSTSEYFAGEVWEDEYDIAQQIIQQMYDNGARNFAIHGFPYGLSAQMDTRLEGAVDKIEELGLAAPIEALSFDKAGAAEELIANYPDIDAIFSSVETVSTVYQPLVNAGKSGKIQLNCYDPNDDAVAAFADGTLSFATTGTCADSQIAFVLLYNALIGSKMTQSDGSAASINMKYIICKSTEELQTAMDNCSASNPAYTLDELTQFIGADAKYEDLKTFAEAFSLEDIQKRHAK